MSQYANFGDQIVLHCEPASQWRSGADVSVLWVKDDVALQANGRTSAMVKRNNLEVKVRSENDFGKYQCLLKTADYGSLLSRPAYIVRARKFILL